MSNELIEQARELATRLRRVKPHAANTSFIWAIGESIDTIEALVARIAQLEGEANLWANR